jgi:hypothetical protein
VKTITLTIWNCLQITGVQQTTNQTTRHQKHKNQRKIQNSKLKYKKCQVDKKVRANAGNLKEHLITLLH